MLPESVRAPCHADGVPLMLQMDDAERFSLYPIQDEEAWKIYKQAQASFWTAEEIDLAGDKWEDLGPDEARFLRTTLAFFAGFDGVVNENLLQNICQRVQLPEMRSFLCFQLAIENIHSETYSLLIDTYITDRTQKLELFNALRTHDATREKAAWTFQWMRPELPFAERLVVFSAVEGIWFSGAFASIYYCKKRGDLHLPGLEFANSLIARDEALHTQMSCLLHRRLWPRGEPIPPTEADALARRATRHCEAAGRSGLQARCAILTATDATIDRSVREAYAGSDLDAGAMDALVDDFAASVRCSDERVREIVRTATEVECRFVRDVLPVRLIGMNADLMQEYVRHVANVLCGLLGVERLFPKTTNPFDWMEGISLGGAKVNFFEARVGEYQKANVMASLHAGGGAEGFGKQRQFTTDDDF